MNRNFYAKAFIAISLVFGLLLKTEIVGAQTGQALNYDGVNDQVQITGYKGVTGLSSRTIEAWINTTTTTQRPILEYGSPVSGQWINFNVRANGQLQLAVSGANSNSTNIVNNGIWHHVAVVITNDGSPNVNEAQFYIDGVLETISSSTPTAINTSAATDVRIGYSPGLNTFFQGAIDEVRIWSTARSGAQISSNMNCELNAQAGLEASYHFNQGTTGGVNTGITSLTDASAFARTGTLINFALTGATSNWIAPGGIFNRMLLLFLLQISAVEIMLPLLLHPEIFMVQQYGIGITPQQVAALLEPELLLILLFC